MFQSAVLDNGLRVIAAPMQGTKTAAVLALAATGSKYENRANNGLSHFLEHIFFKGSARRPSALAVSSALDGLGAEYNAFTGKECTGYWVKAEVRRLPEAMDILSDMLGRPCLPAVEINRERGVILEEMNMYRDNPIMFIEDLWEGLLYGDTPAGWDTIGTKENILRLAKPDFQAYLDSQYGPANMIVSIAGAVSPSLVLKLANRYFNTRFFSVRGRSFHGKEAVVERQSAPGLCLHEKKTDQAHLALGVRAYPYDHPDKLAVRLLSIILGGSMSSRLFSSLRERRGLAYYIRAKDEVYTDSGYLAAWAGVPVPKLPLAIDIILKEFKRIARQPVADKELRLAKDLYRGRAALQLESADDLAGWYGRQAITLLALARGRGKNPPLALKTPARFFHLLDKITAADLRRVARDIFRTERLNLAVISPETDARKISSALAL